MALSRHRRMTLIIGPCGAGKITYLRARHPDCLQVDQEMFLAALLGGQRRYWPQARRLARILYHDAYHECLATGLEVAVTSDGATRATRTAFIAPARAAGYAVAIARARSDPGRPKTARSAWPDIIARWYRVWEPVSAGEYDTYQEVDRG